MWVQRSAVLTSLCLALGCLGGPAGAETLIDVWRSPFGVPRSVSVDTSDGSCWAVTGSSIMHIAADGTVLSQSDGFWYPQSVSANSADGTCWVADRNNEQLVRLDADGGELLRLDGFDLFWSVSVNPVDGSCWTAGRDIARVAADGTQIHRQRAYLGQSVCVNPADGSCWVSHLRHPDYGEVIEAALSRYSEDGARLWTNFDLDTGPLSVNDTDGTCWLGGSDAVFHVSADGLGLGEYAYGGRAAVSVNPADGSLWVAPCPMGPSLLHLAEDGAELWSGWPGYDVLSVSVNPTDGSCWAGVEGDLRDDAWLFHLAEDGSELWRGSDVRSYPGRIAVDPNDGSCWATYGDRVLHLDAHGRVLRTIDGFVGVGSIALDPTDGSCWVGEYHDDIDDWSEVHHIASDGIGLWSGGDFERIESIAVDPADGSCWVADHGSLPDNPDGSVTHLGSDGAELWRGGSFYNPHALAVYPGDGSCWVADGESDCVVHLAADGAELLRRAGFWYPSSVAVSPDDGSCWVADTRNGRVLHLASDGTVLSESATLESPRWLCVDSDDGSCWVVDGVNNKNMGNLVHLSQTGTEVSRSTGIGSDSPIAVSELKDSIWVVDSGSGQLARFRHWFEDVPRIHWAFRAILACVEADLVAGYPGGLYRPDNPVSRDQMAVYIARALAGGNDKVPDSSGDPTFPDVLADFWAHKYVEYAVENNVVAGYEDGLYHPELTVDRAQMAVYIARSIATPTGEEGLVGYTPSDPRNFPDVPEDFWAWLHIEYCVENGVVQGYEDGLYHPEYLVTRDQMAVYIARAFDLLE